MPLCSGLARSNNLIISRRKTTESIITDPSFSNVSFLAHMNGANDSTNFVDNSINNLTVTRSGNTVIKTAQSKYGGASAYFDGTGDYLTVTDNNVVTFASSLFTIEFWFYLTSLGTARTLFYTKRSSGWSPILIIVNSQNELVAYCSTTGGSFAHYMYSSVNSVQLNTWYHVAYVRYGTGGQDFRLFLNGNIHTSSVYLENVTSMPSSTGFDIALTSSLAGGSDFIGYIDDFRITKNVARYTNNFTPPTAQFPDA